MQPIQMGEIAETMIDSQAGLTLYGKITAPDESIGQDAIIYLDNTAIELALSALADHPKYAPMINVANIPGESDTE